MIWNTLTIVVYSLYTVVSSEDFDSVNIVQRLISLNEIIAVISHIYM